MSESFGFWMRTFTARRSSSPSPGSGSMPETSIERGSRFGKVEQAPSRHEQSSKSEVVARTAVPRRRVGQRLAAGVRQRYGPFGHALRPARQRPRAARYFFA